MSDAAHKADVIANVVRDLEAVTDQAREVLRRWQWVQEHAGIIPHRYRFDYEHGERGHERNNQSIVAYSESEAWAVFGQHVKLFHICPRNITVTDRGEAEFYPTRLVPGEDEG